MSSCGATSHITSAAPPPTSIKEHTTAEYAFTVIIGLCAAFSAGYTNAVCLSGFIHIGDISTKSSVAGVTGLYTNSAIALAVANWYQFKLKIGTIFSVMVGAFMASFLNPYPIAFEISPRYGPTFLLGSLFMLGGAIPAMHNNQREFYFTAIGNGIQNGVSSMYSANLLRTSHLTGTTTDIGLFIGMSLRGNHTNNWKLYILIGLAVSFWTGSIAGFFASQTKRQYSLIFNACFFFAIAMSVMIRTCYVYKVPFYQAALGVGKWSTTLDQLDVVKETSDNKDADVENALGVDELMRVFDEMDANQNGKVDQHILIEQLTAHKVYKKRKRFAAILYSAYILHDDKEGDWQISREDFKHLIEHSQVMEHSLRTSTRTSTGPGMSKSMPVGSMASLGEASIAVGPEALRRMSYASYRHAGH